MLETGDLPIAQLAQLALREGQSTSPLHRVHRWFARRLGSQFRAMLAALSLDENGAERFWERYSNGVPLGGAVALDPFAGGGTALVEASRCGARVIGFDLDPVAVSISRFELGAAARQEMSETISETCARVLQRVLPLHKVCVEGEEKDVLHHFWVQVDACLSCGREFEVHPHYRLAYDKDRDRQWAFCRGCHGVQELPLSRKELRCRCGTRTKIGRGTLYRGRLECPHCKFGCDLSRRGMETGVPPRWRLFAQEYLDTDRGRETRRFRTATEADRALYRSAAAELERLEDRSGPFVPDRAIPTADRIDRRPLIHGFERYRQLFNERQLLHLSLLGRTISELQPGSDREVMALAFSEHLATNCIYAGYAFGYRRLSPLFSVHAYRHIVRPVELNPWLRGRGTYLNALEKIRRGVAFAKTPTDVHPAGGRTTQGRPVGPRDGKVGRTVSEVVEGELEASMSVRDSTDLSDVPDGSVDLILTDPPYFDNVCYSELSDFYLVWHQALGTAEPSFDEEGRSAPMRRSLAPANRSAESVRGYAEGLLKVLRECARVLKTDGVCVFTYHHSSPLAWLCLGEALADSGLRCSAVLPLRGEGQGGLHSYNGTIKWDAVLVCRKAEGTVVRAGRAVVVPEGSCDRASDIVSAYAARLSGVEGIGFADPDRLNLYRALIASEARIGEPTAGWIILEAALKANPGRVGEVPDG